MDYVGYLQGEIGNGFPKIRGTFLGVPTNEGQNMFGPILGLLGSYHLGVSEKGCPLGPEVSYEGYRWITA